MSPSHTLDLLKFAVEFLAVSCILLRIFFCRFFNNQRFRATESGCRHTRIGNTHRLVMQRQLRSRDAKITLPQRVRDLFYSASPPPLRNAELVHSNPNVYIIHDFLTAKELEYIDQLATENARRFKDSFTQNDEGGETYSELRTSTYMYLNKAQDRLARNIEARAADLVGVPPGNVEPLQVVSYTAGQLFDTHHDAGTMVEDGSIDLVPPVRYATLFLYLNTLPEGEGHTEFPEIGLSVRPVRGSGVLFCNIDQTGRAEPKTTHRANPVNGSLRKFGMNIWITNTDLQHLALLKKKYKIDSKAEFDPAQGIIMQSHLKNMRIAQQEEAAESKPRAKKPRKA